MVKYNITTKSEKEAAYRSLVSPGLMDELEEKINNIIIIQKKFKDKNYSAKQLAEDLNTNTRYISAVVNVRFHVNYTSYVNKFRIQEAMSLLVDRRYQDLNMEEYRMKHLKNRPALTEKTKKRGQKSVAKVCVEDAIAVAE